MIRQFALAAAAALAMTGAALADPIEGRWKTDAGSTAQISSCSGGFCIKLVSGSHSGKQIGRMSATGKGAYKGTITDPASDKTYNGDATLNGTSLKMRGCVMAVLCRSQNWTKM